MKESQPGLPLINSVHIHRIVVITGQIFSSAPSYSVYMESLVGYILNLKNYFTIYGLLPYTPIKLYDHFISAFLVYST